MSELLCIDVVGSVFLRGEALAAGYSEREIQRLSSDGTWHRVRRGAYVAGEMWRRSDEAAQHALRARAVIKQARTEVVLSHVSALPEYGAPLWGLRTDVVHVTRTDRRGGRREAGVHQHLGVIVPEHVTERRGVLVTDATRTAIDITTVAGPEPSLCVVNHLLHEGLTTMEQIAERYSDMVHNPHTLRTDLVMRLAQPAVESVAESRTYFLCWRHGIPAPVPQYVVRDESGREVARLDFAWPELGVWLEFDGKSKYSQHLRPGETPADAVFREKQREDLVRELTGWRCIRITWADLERAERTATRIKAALRIG
ncbi:hypothetical protein ACFP3Q_03810 [Nocardioides sp. GCM10027113]|uniref:hypothetical protein n=1 Tax=unclassified Nocardioides TaxID=2615069 RepID=UPI00360C33C8